MKRKIKLVIWAMAIMLLPFQMSSCSEHIEEWHGNVTAGCVLLSNNSIIPLQNYDSSSMQGVGVVVGTREDSVWVVSAKELGLYAYLDTLTSVSDVSSDESALCGIENTAAMLKSDRKSPAVNAIVSFPSPVKGWILPSIGEMRMLSANLGTIGKAMETIGGDAFLTTPYLSSTQDGSSTQTQELYAKCITLHSGYVSSILKTEQAQVRPVLRMKMK